MNERPVLQCKKEKSGKRRNEAAGGESAVFFGKVSVIRIKIFTIRAVRAIIYT